MNCLNLCFPEPLSGVKVENMCGRYASARKRIELLEEFGVERDRVTEPLEPDYNVAPTKPVYAVLTRRPRSSEAGGDSETANGCRRRGSGWRQGRYRPGRRRQVRRRGAGTPRRPLGAGPVLGQGQGHRQPHDQRAGRDRGRQAGLSRRVRAAAVPATRRRLLRVVPARQRREGGHSCTHPPADGRPLAFAGLYESMDRAVR